MKSLLVAVPVLLSSAIALAQPGYGPPPPPPEPMGDASDPLRQGSFMTTDRFDMNNRVGIEAAYTLLDSDLDAQLFGFDLHGHYIDPASGFGGYAQLPFGYVTGDNVDNKFGIGNLELGALFAKHLSREAGLIARLGLVVPTAPDEDAFVNYLSFERRITDIASAVDDAKTVRMSVSPMFRSGQVFARIDAGVDLVFHDDDHDTVLRLNGGFGIDLGTARLMAELNYVRISQPGDDDDAKNLAVSARFHGGGVDPYVGVVIPLDDQVNDVIKAVIVAGLDFRI